MSDCSNPNCLDGWIEVDGPAYAELVVPMPDQPTAEQVAAVTARRHRYASATTVRPCGDCSPGRLERWANGCFRPRHRRSSCDLCIAAAEPVGASR